MTNYKGKTRREWQDAWIAALRSGEYRQAQYLLKDETGAMCCLGVAKLLFQGDQAFEAYDDADKPDRAENLGYDHDVIEAFGFKSSNGNFRTEIKTPLHRHSIVSFVDANDSVELSFEQIADLAEKYRDFTFES